MSSSTSNSERPRSGGYLFMYALTCAACAALVGALNWWVDPLQFYRRATYQPVFSENQRYQNPGLARTYDYETIVLGTSHAENLLAGDIRDRLGEAALKLAISGSTAREQALMLDLALGTGKVRHVIWALDKISFSKPPMKVNTQEGPFPFHLYEQGPRTAALYLLSTDTLALSVGALTGRGHRDLETLNAWHAEYEYGPAQVMADWHRRGRILDRANVEREGPQPSLDDVRRRSVRANLVAPIRSRPDVRFDLFFPPFSILSYLADFRSWETAFDERQRFKAFVVASTAGLPNVRVFDFQGVREITHALVHYKDLEHYSLRVNRWILDALATGHYRVEEADYEAELARQAQQVQAYRREVCEGDPARRALCPRVAARRSDL